MTVTMFGCESFAADRASRRNRSTYVVVARIVLVEDLDRDVALEQPVVRPVDARHAARADELLELVPVRDHLADHHGGIVPAVGELGAGQHVLERLLPHAEGLVELGVGDRRAARARG